MPKDRRVDSPIFDRARVSPYACSLKTADRNISESSLPLVGDEIEWQEVRCPICMEHPHNAVLLICSSRERGCRPFMCDTSYRHSNCLDQFRKLSTLASSSSAPQEQQSELVCPLCRGQITGLVVKDHARRFMNSKSRGCSLETCKFSGNYTQLRKHARLEHPSDRPSEPCQVRQSNWEILERQRDIYDALAHQLDFENDWDGWPSWNELGDADFWSDGSLFDFPIEEMSDIEGEVIGGLPLSYASLYSSSTPELEMMNSDFTSSPDRLGRRSTPTTSNHGGDPFSIARSAQSHQRANNSAISWSRSGSQGENSNSRSSYHAENASESARARARSSPHSGGDTPRV